MAQKKKNQLSSENQSTQNPNLWPNLPHQLINLIARQPNLMQNITSFGCVAKSWRSPSKKCSPHSNPRLPQLVEINGKRLQAKARSHVIEIKFHEEFPFFYYKRRSYKKYYPGMYFKGHSHGLVIVMGANMSDCYLWKPAVDRTSYLPPWNPSLVFKVCALSSSLEDRGGCNVMVLTGASSPAFAFYRRWGKNPETGWSIQDCTVKEPYDPSKNMQFNNAIGFQGKFYALSLQGSLAVIEDVDSCFRITAVGGSRAVPSKVSRQFREYLVESDGEILLVFLVSRKSIDVVEDVEVFRLDFCKLLWVKVERLGDRTLFLEDECCMSVASSKVGCKKNCIYFTHHRVESWWIFDVETGEISPVFGSDEGVDQESVMWDEIMELE